MNSALVRANTISAALDIECAALNAAIESGKLITFQTAFGPYRLQYMCRSDMWGTCIAIDAAGKDCGPIGRGFAFCNDGCWDNMIRQAGIARHAIFDKMR